MLPPVQVREVLEASRRAGVAFGDAWPAALEGIQNVRWLEALSQTAGAWERAYGLEPIGRGEAAIDLLSRGLAGELADLDAAARCPWCGCPMPPPLPRGRRTFCSRRCASAALRDRDRDREPVAVS